MEKYLLVVEIFALYLASVAGISKVAGLDSLVDLWFNHWFDGRIKIRPEDI